VGARWWSGTASRSHVGERRDLGATEGEVVGDYLGELI
jgi:hypothetical protein